MRRRLVIWTAAAVLALSLAGWVMSLWKPQVALARPRWTRIGLLFGGVEVHRTVLPLNARGWPSSVDFYHMWWPYARLDRASIVVDMSQFKLRSGVVGMIFVPMWMPVAASSVALMVAHKGSSGRKHPRTGHCRSCGYDITGITGPCPECGQEGEPGRSCRSLT
jgi:hypothetical protein